MKHRVIFCTYPGIYSDLVLEELLCSEVIDLVGVVLSSRVLYKNYNRFYASLCQIRRSGFYYAFYLFVVTGIYPVLLRMLGRPGLYQRLKKYEIPVLNTKNINNEQGQVFIRELQADFMLSAHFNQLVGSEILNIQGMKCLNIHPSLLPEYKGVDPAFYALLREEQFTGVTVHLQDIAFDTGQILAQKAVKITAEDSLMGLNLKLFRQGVFTAIEQIQNMPVGMAQVGEGSYDSWPDSGAVRVFRRFRKLFRWQELIELVAK